MKVLIIDNEVRLRTGLKLLLQSVNNSITAIEEADGVQSGLQAIKSFSPDIVLLDVEMDDGTGFDLLKQLNNPAFQLIFVTAHNKYAIEAFQFSAIDYLLKPVDTDALQKSIAKAFLNIKNKDLKSQIDVLLHQLAGIQSRDRKIVLKDVDNTYFIKVADILYLEAEGTYTKFFFTNAEPMLVSKNLKEYGDILEPLGFLRTHHSFLVNTDKIKLFDKTDGGVLVLDGGFTIPVSQRKKEYVMQMLEKR
jgi:two-component system, LytTR family, response regulator